MSNIQKLRALLDMTSFFYYTPLKKGGDHITQLSEREKAVTQIFDRYNKNLEILTRERRCVWI